MENDELRTLAKRRLTARNEFNTYLLVWLGVSVLVVAIWALTNAGGYFWPVWPILGMGIGAVAKGYQVIRPEHGYISEEAIDAEAARLSR